jgi:hypothetical protein
MPRAANNASTVCEPDALTSRARNFVEAYDQGEAGLADRFFAPAGRFQWYSENDLRQGPEAYDRSTLDGYLTLRQQQGDHLELVNVTPSDGGNFAFTARRADKLLPSKGAIDCRSGLFIVWSLGPNPGP